MTPGERVELRAYFGRLEDRYLMVRGDTTSQGWRWAAYSGHLDDYSLRREVCGVHKDCPFVTHATPALLNVPVTGGLCDESPMGLRLPAQKKVVLPGQTANWGEASDGNALYLLLLTGSSARQGCRYQQLAGEWGYLLLEGGRPHPLIEVQRNQVLLEQIPTQVRPSLGVP